MLETELEFLNMQIIEANSCHQINLITNRNNSESEFYKQAGYQLTNLTELLSMYFQLRQVAQIEK